MPELVSPKSDPVSSLSQPPYAFITARSDLFFGITFPGLRLDNLGYSPPSSTTLAKVLIRNSKNAQPVCHHPQDRVSWTHKLNSLIILASVTDSSRAQRAKTEETWKLKTTRTTEAQEKYCRRRAEELSVLNRLVPLPNARWTVHTSSRLFSS